uniref:FTH domain-containing protein n=1 Tax=Panagrellus redivivus TaxID=6233 RepID=A0A7E4ZRT2_PANRE
MPLPVKKKLHAETLKRLLGYCTPAEVNQFQIAAPHVPHFGPWQEVIMATSEETVGNAEGLPVRSDQAILTDDYRLKEFTDQPINHLTLANYLFYHSFTFDHCTITVKLINAVKDRTVHNIHAFNIIGRGDTKMTAAEICAQFPRATEFHFRDFEFDKAWATDFNHQKVQGLKFLNVQITAAFFEVQQKEFLDFFKAQDDDFWLFLVCPDKTVRESARKFLEKVHFSSQKSHSNRRVSLSLSVKDTMDYYPKAGSSVK